LLLFVARADARGAPGTVQQISPGLLRGYISHFADPTNIPYTIPSAEWLTLCRAARELVPIRARAQAWMTCCVDVMVQPPTFHAAPVDGVIVMFTAPSQVLTRWSLARPADRNRRWIVSDDRVYPIERR
jgi:hypothetical protein